MSDSQIATVIESLHDLAVDSTVPRNVKAKIENTIHSLQENVEISIRVNRALQALEEIADDSNMQTYTRMQLMNIMSMLENVR